MTGPSTIQPARYRIGDVVFDAATGEVRARSDADQPRVTRLAPKPAHLLVMLIENAGELVSIERIREALWPDVRVEFDQGMHHCVRQVRAALGDTASSPTYIETLPRRGYRLMVTPEALDVPAPVATGEHRRPAVARVPMVIAFAVAVLGVITAATIMTAGGGPPLTRIAVMPTNPPADYTMSNTVDVGSLLVAELDRREACIVIGPSTTARFLGSDAPVADAGQQLDVELIVNARYLQRDGRDHVLMELIRTSDGAHVWTRLYDATASAERIASEVVEALMPWTQVDATVEQ